MTSADAITALKAALGSGGYCDTPDMLPPYTTSWRNKWVGATPLVALPATTEQVASVVRICAAHNIPIVPQGGNTGLVDGGVPTQKGNELLLSLKRMNKIRAFDPIGSTVTAEAGCILKNLQDSATEQGFLFPLSMASEGSATVGGAIATNAGGTAVLRYGNMRDLVLGLEVVLADGTIYTDLKGLRKDNAGYNLNHYFIGAEGTLGIVTAAVLKLYPAPRQTVTAIAAIPDATAALALLGAFRAACGEHVTAFEIMAHGALELVTRHFPAMRLPCATTTPFYLLIELTSANAAIPLRAMFETAAAQALDTGTMRDAVLAESGAQTEQFWSLREHVPPALRQEGRSIHFDISLPLDQIADFLDKTTQKITAAVPGTTVIPFGHIGDGNLHYNMYLPRSMDDATQRVSKRRIQDIVFHDVTARHGSISAEHGIGMERKRELAEHRPAHDLDLMRRIKRAFDPQNILNPGRIFDAQ